ncbi:hypothetical protein IJ102_00725 [Candidatus Saccharibacteria bacterium]|nr:hypothetical protein [Candidatus Saccharibacteria bacterium]
MSNNTGNKTEKVVYGQELLDQVILSAEATQQTVKIAHQDNLKAHLATQAVTKEDGDKTREALATVQQHFDSGISYIESLQGRRPLWWLIVCVFGAIITAIVVYWFLILSGQAHLPALGSFEPIMDSFGNIVDYDKTKWILADGAKALVIFGGGAASAAFWAMIYNIIPITEER